MVLLDQLAVVGHRLAEVALARQLLNESQAELCHPLVGRPLLRLLLVSVPALLLPVLKLLLKRCDPLPEHFLCGQPELLLLLGLGQPALGGLYALLLHAGLGLVAVAGGEDLRQLLQGAGQVPGQSCQELGELGLQRGQRHQVLVPQHPQSSVFSLLLPEFLEELRPGLLGLAVDRLLVLLADEHAVVLVLELVVLRPQFRVEPVHLPRAEGHFM